MEFKLFSLQSVSLFWLESNNYALVSGALQAYGSRFVCACVYLYVCNVFLGDHYKLTTAECNAGTTRQYLKSNSLKFW